VTATLYLLLALVVCVVALPFLHAWAWCFADLRRDRTLDQTARSQWLFALVVLSVVAIPVYVSSGPGKERWNPRLLWWPWKR
jgi:hypothetical protein